MVQNTTKIKYTSTILKKIKDIVSQMPYESGQVDEMFDEKEDTPHDDENKTPDSKPQDDIQDFGVHFDDLPDFEPASNQPAQKADDKDKPKEDEKQKPQDKPKKKPDNSEEKTDKPKDKAKPKRTMDLFSQGKKSLNDSLSKSLKIGLNDRLSFVNQLFKGDTQAYENFIGHINTLENLEEAKSFLNQQIQEKYSHWKDKEEVANRLLNHIEKKFE